MNYPNLIGPSIENTPLKFKLLKGLKNTISIQIENIEFRMISKVYL
jgi:hypothetical protein